jgi:hypothetical protein
LSKAEKLSDPRKFFYEHSLTEQNRREMQKNEKNFLSFAAGRVQRYYKQGCQILSWYNQPKCQ